MAPRPRIEVIERITTPIGLPAITGKDPATVALSVAAALVSVFERETAAARDAEPARR